MLSIGVTEISALGPQKNLAMSQSLFESDGIKRQEMVTAVLTFTNMHIGVQLVYWSWH